MEYLGHNFIIEYTKNYFKNASWLYLKNHMKTYIKRDAICIKCKIYVPFYNSINDDGLKKINITCNEYIIKKLLE